MKSGTSTTHIFKNGCVIFTIITLVIYGIGAVLSDKDKAFIPTFQWILLFFLFSQLLSAVQQILRWDKISLFLRIFLHFSAAALLYVVAVILCGGLYKNGVTLLLSIILFIVGYVVFAVVYTARMRRRKNIIKGKEPYKAKFQ